MSRLSDPRASLSLLAERWLSQLLSRIVGLLSHRKRLEIASKMASTALEEDKLKIHHARKNVRCVFPSSPPSEIRDLLLRSAQRIARSRLDFVWSWSASEQQLRSVVELVGMEAIDFSKPTVMVGFHQPGFELAAMRLSLDLSAAGIYDMGGQQAPGAFAHIFSRFKRQRMIEVSQAATGAIRAIRSGLPLWVLVDHPPVTASTVQAQALGVSLRLSSLASMLARRCGAQVVFLAIDQHDEDRRYKVQLSGPVSAAQASDAKELAQLTARRLADLLLTKPDMYCWPSAPRHFVRLPQHVAASVPAASTQGRQEERQLRCALLQTS